MSNNIKFPLNFKTGLGYSPNSGPPVGGWPAPPGEGFFGQPLSTVLPGVRLFGKKKKVNKSRHFGYPLMNTPSSELNMRTFPLPPVGNGDSIGGKGGVFLQGLPNFQSYWGFGKKSKRSKKSKRRSKRSKRSKKSKKSKKF